MKCPLLEMGWLADTDNSDSCSRDCLKEECAWWDHKHGVCTVKVIKKALVDLTEILANIQTKTPHEGQFRK